MPQNRAAYLSTAKAPTLTIGDAPYYEPGPDEVLIKNNAVAINPVDWKIQDHDFLVKEYPTILGCDVAGTVEKVGSGVTAFKVGDRVMAQAEMLCLGIKYGAFQSYLLAPANVVCRIPNELSFAAASVLPLAVNTAALALFQPSHIGLPAPTTSPISSDKTVLIYGGSTSVGSTAIQLAKAAGAIVVAVASKANHAYCTDLGADEVIDYRATNWVDQAVTLLKGKNFVGIYDTISTETTYKQIAELISKVDSKPSVAVVGPTPEGVDLKVNGVFGAEMTFKAELAKAVWGDFLPAALAQGSLLPKPEAEVVAQGLEGIQDAMNVQRKGVSAKKIVVELQ